MAGQLKMSFDPMTIEHLGVRMYSTLPPVLSELIANSYDADAKKVNVILRDVEGSKEIVVEDDGVGMSFSDLNEKFLRIGRNRRTAEGTDEVGEHRKVIGKKGLGKLSFFGVAQEIEVVTRKGGKENAFLMRWEDIDKPDKNEYEPTPLRTEEDCDPNVHGTIITLRGIKRESDFAPESLATSLSRIFITDPGFAIAVQHNGGKPIAVSNDRKYESLDKHVEWTVPADLKKEGDYLKEKKITGHLIATRKPIPPNTNMRGITLFSRKKLVNVPEYFSDSTSSHFFSYLTGWLEVDFIDDLPEDVISTNRQSLNWGHPEMEELKKKLKSILDWLQQDWRDKRAALRDEALTEKSGIKVKEWLDTMPEAIRAEVAPILTQLLKDSELPDEATSGVVKRMHELVPEYPLFHWRHLHPKVQTASESYYISQDYYTAFFEAVKAYVNAVKSKSNSQLTDNALLENVFALKSPKLSVTEKFKKPDGGDFEPDTIENMAGGHRMLALGIWLACRCPIAHEEVRDLRDSGLFTEQDCLDALSLLSHLFYRLDNATLVP